MCARARAGQRPQKAVLLVLLVLLPRPGRHKRSKNSNTTPEKRCYSWCYTPRKSGESNMIDVQKELAPVERQFLSELKAVGWSDEEVRELGRAWAIANQRSEEHTSELQSRGHLVCRLLLEKKK